MQEQKALVTIKGVEYKLKCTVGFWGKIKEKCDITGTNISTKINEDSGANIPWIIMYAAYYGMAEKPESIDKMPFTIKDIEEEIDRSAIDAIEQAVIDGMTVEEKRLVEIARGIQEKKFRTLEEPSGKNV